MPISTHTTRHVFVIGQTPGPGFVVEHDYALTTKVPDSDKLFATMPDWSGRIWFVTRNGIVGTIDQGNGAIKTLDYKIRQSSELLRFTRVAHGKDQSYRLEVQSTGDESEDLRRRAIEPVRVIHDAQDRPITGGLR